ncbi:MAG: helix-turn-helix transcriptional regulator [Sphingomonadaceae bacterium]|nr:helix-turn-helix transcriptional regulator [Sphingomonadaceae bacterium]
MDMRVLVGQNFSRLRQKAGLTQEEVAERSGFSQQFISGLERGHRNPTVVSIFELTQAIGAEPIDLFQSID